MGAPQSEHVGFSYLAPGSASMGVQKIGEVVVVEAVEVEPEGESITQLGPGHDVHGGHLVYRSGVGRAVDGAGGQEKGGGVTPQQREPVSEPEP